MSEVAFCCQRGYDSSMVRKFLDKVTSKQTISWSGRHFMWLASIGAVVFMVISLWIGMQQSVWFDEAYSIIIAKQPAAQLVHLTALDTHPPLYYLILKGWVSVFGWSELALRSLSILLGGIAVFVAALLLRRMFSARVAALALPFVALAPFLLRFGFEIRMYVLASLIGVLATYMLVRARQAGGGKDQRNYYIVYTILVALGMYTLYYIAVLWIAHAAWLVWSTLRDKKPLFRQPWLLAYVASIVLFLPWLPAFVSQISNGALASISQAMTVDNLVGLVSFQFLYQPVWQLGGFASLVVVGVIIVLGYVMCQAYRATPKAERQYITLLVMYFAVPVIIVTLISLVRPMYVERYLSHVAIGFMMLVGVLSAVVWIRGSQNMRWAVTGLVLVMVSGIFHLAAVGNYNFQRLQKPAVNAIAAQMKSCRDGDTVFAADPYVAIELDYYLPDCPIYFYSQTDVLRGGYAPLSQSPLRIGDSGRELASSKKILYVYYDKSHLAMPNGFRQTDSLSYGALNLAVFSAE